MGVELGLELEQMWGVDRDDVDLLNPRRVQGGGIRFR